jgi:hypothetical protein
MLSSQGGWRVRQAASLVLILLPFAVLVAAVRLQIAREPATRAVDLAIPRSTITSAKESGGGMTEDDEINAILDSAGPTNEPDSKLWADLAKWGFADGRDIPPSDEMTDAQAEALLDEAAATVSGLTTAEDWKSAGRYFQAENFHGLERPACTRAIALAKRQKETK